MPTEEEFETVLEEFPQMIAAIGDEVTGDLSSHNRFSVGGDDAVGYWCRHGDEEYAVYTTSDEEFYTIFYIDSVIPNIARSLGDDLIDELLEDYSEDEIESVYDRPDVTEVGLSEVPEKVKDKAEGEISESEIDDIDELPDEVQDEFIGGRELLAAKEILLSTERGRMEAIKRQLRDELNDPRLAFGLLLEENAMEGFHLTRKIFPYEDTFGLQELYDSVQAVISIGVAGHNTMANVFNETMSENIKISDESQQK